MKRLWAMVVLATLVLATAGGDADARRRKKRPAAAAPVTEEPAPAAAEPKKKKRTKVYDFSGLGIEGTMRTPQLLYFLGRAKEELERASLEKRSFMPELYRSVDEGGL